MIMKLSEVLYATLAQWLGLAFVAVVAIRTPIDVPEVALGVALASWLLATACSLARRASCSSRAETGPR